MSDCVQNAIARATEDAQATAFPSADNQPRQRHFAIGDPQAPLAHFLEILDTHGLLADNGRLVSDVHLVSVGDHFDYGTPEEAERASFDGLRLLAWLAAHPPDQVTLIAGNHDLSRVGELAHVSDEEFAEARVEATRAYYGDDAVTLDAFSRRFPKLPGVEAVARDFCTFSEAQRALVTRLLAVERFRMAYAFDEHTLVCHAGVTVSDLERANLRIGQSSDAFSIARALNRVLSNSFAAWSGREPLRVADLHVPGSSLGEGGGMLYHRPCHPTRGKPSEFEGPRRRRFDPRLLPKGIVQVIGHVTDSKCRELLGEWVVDSAAAPGELRQLITDGESVTYARGSLPKLLNLEQQAAIVFVDGSMRTASADAYALVDLSMLSEAHRSMPGTV